MIRGGLDKSRVSDDMLQDAREAAGKAVRTWDPAKGEFSTWITARVRYAIADHIRREAGGMVGGRDTHGTTGTYVDVTPCDKKGGEQIAVEQSEVGFVQALLLQIGDSEERQVLRLRFGFDGEPMKMLEVARRIGKSLATTERIYSQVQKRLRGIVKKSR